MNYKSPHWYFIIIFDEYFVRSRKNKQYLQRPMPAPDSRWCGQDVWRWEMSRRHVTRAPDVARVRAVWGLEAGELAQQRRSTHSTPHYCSTRAVDDFSNFSQFLEKFIDLFKVPTSAFALKNLLHYTKRIFKHSKSFVIFLIDYLLLVVDCCNVIWVALIVETFAKFRRQLYARERFIAASSWLCGARP